MKFVTFFQVLSLDVRVDPSLEWIAWKGLGDAIHARSSHHGIDSVAERNGDGVCSFVDLDGLQHEDSIVGVVCWRWMA